eukprot:scaffold184_cov316-Pinguiococcus_pyrenoidosus.AAC.37
MRAASASATLDVKSAAHSASGSAAVSRTITRGGFRPSAVSAIAFACSRNVLVVMTTSASACCTWRPS